MSRRDWGDVIAGVFALAVVGLLVRPSSLGPGLVKSLGDALVSMVSFVSDASAGASAQDSTSSGTVYA